MYIYIHYIYTLCLYIWRERYIYVYICIDILYRADDGVDSLDPIAQGYSFPCDIWSAGCVLYAVATGSELSPVTNEGRRELSKVPYIYIYVYICICIYRANPRIIIRTIFRTSIKTIEQYNSYLRQAARQS